MSIKDDFNIKIIATKHEKIAKALVLFWGEKEFNPYIEKLIKNDDERYKREGFSLEILTALLNLQSLHNKSFPNLELKENNVWLKNNRLI